MILSKSLKKLVKKAKKSQNKEEALYQMDKIKKHGKNFNLISKTNNFAVIPKNNINRPIELFPLELKHN